MIDVYDLAGLFTDSCQKVDIYSLTEQKVVFRGTLEDAMFSSYGTCLVESIDTLYDPTDVLTININTGDE